jgi:tRNA dimethylallyltransferase
LIAIFGPTAVGKTEVAIELAELVRERGEDPVAVSADAFQVYEGLDLLTAKPGQEQLRRLEHRMISFVPIDRTFSVAEFAERAHEEIDRLLDQGRRPLVVGGTGLYLRAALTELELKPPPEPGLREEIERELAELGLKALHAQLPAESAEAVHPNDRKRIIRLLELERMGEQPYGNSTGLWSDELRRPAALVGLVAERETLSRRISVRTDEMIEAGVVGEVERALEQGASSTARQAIGFSEVEAHLRGAITLKEAASGIKRRQRQYVRRQLTWMRKLAGVEVIDRTGRGARETAATILHHLAGRLT